MWAGLGVRVVCVCATLSLVAPPGTSSMAKKSSSATGVGADFFARAGAALVRVVGVFSGDFFFTALFLAGFSLRVDAANMSSKPPHSSSAEAALALGSAGGESVWSACSAPSDCRRRLVHAVKGQVDTFLVLQFRISTLTSPKGCVRARVSMRVTVNAGARVKAFHSLVRMLLMPAFLALSVSSASKPESPPRVGAGDAGAG